MYISNQDSEKIIEVGLISTCILYAILFSQKFTVLLCGFVFFFLNFFKIKFFDCAESSSLCADFL